jgi:dTDP-4-amino-4,6-dideoxygalactose transaminase
LHSLDFLDANIARRNELVDLFWSELEGIPGLRRPTVDAGDVSTYKDLTLVVTDAGFGLTAEQLGQALREEGIDTRRYYYPPIHQQHAYRMLPKRALPVTDRLSREVLSVPLWSHMEADQILRTADAIARIRRHAARVRSALVPRQRS